MVVDKNKHSQVLLTLPKELLDEVEMYWHEHRLPNRMEAFRELIRKGLLKE